MRQIAFFFFIWTAGFLQNGRGYRFGQAKPGGGGFNDSGFLKEWLRLSVLNIGIRALRARVSEDAESKGHKWIKEWIKDG